MFPGLRNRVRQARPGQLSTNFSHDYLVSSLNSSLKRLRTDCVDVFMLHGPPPEVLADLELFDRLAGLVAQGKTRSLGVSVDNVGHVALAAAIPQVQAIQLPVGRRHAKTLRAILPEISTRGVALIGRELFEGVDPKAGQSERTAVVREALSLPAISAVLIGMSSIDHLEANLTALK
jgi:aryl-alcohol dehydrogenase-like predicted oxidoreductase